MNIPIVLAVVVAFGLLRFRRASLLLWAGAWWVGLYVLLRFGFTTPIPASVISIYMGIVSLAILAYLSSSQERREEVSGPLIRFMTERRYTPFLGAMAVAIPALAAANVYVQMNVPIEPPFFPRTIHPASPSEITVQDNRVDDRCWGQPVPGTRNIESGRVPQACRERAPGLLSELRLLPRRQPGGQRHVRPRVEPDPDQLCRRANAPESQRDISVLANLQGRSGAARRGGRRGTQPCPPGRSSSRKRRCGM